MGTPWGKLVVFTDPRAAATGNACGTYLQVELILKQHFHCSLASSWAGLCSMTAVNLKEAEIEGCAGFCSTGKLCQCRVSSFGSCVKAAIAFFPSYLAARTELHRRDWHLASAAFGNVLIMHFFAATAQ